MFAALDTNNTKGVCINDNGLFCIKLNDYDNSKEALKNHFGESTCSDNGSYFRCASDAFSCTANSNGYVNCNDTSASEKCNVHPSGAVVCS
ncbi:unknown [Firmicutes bacterium CAG:582]|nr:unknown [Firmicutes bacterium CAG:582]